MGYTSLRGSDGSMPLSTRPHAAFDPAAIGQKSTFHAFLSHFLKFPLLKMSGNADGRANPGIGTGSGKAESGKEPSENNIDFGGRVV